MVSGLDVGALDPPDAQLQMLSEYLAAEAGGSDEQASVSRISRLIIAGNSLAPVVVETQEPEKKSVDTTPLLEGSLISSKPSVETRSRDDDIFNTSFARTVNIPHRHRA